MAAARDGVGRMLAFVSIGFGAIALLLACIGIGTPNWQTTYTTSTSNQLQIASTNNFFYACIFSTNGNVTCYNRNASLIGYVNTGFYGLSTFTSSNDTNTRLQNAGGLCIVGIVFIALGVIFTLVMAIRAISTWFDLVPPTLLFLACLFMLAGLAEGARALIYNDYAANLYQAGHLLTMLSFGLSALAAGRFHFEPNA